MQIRRYPTYHLQFDSKQEQEAFELFSIARQVARKRCKEGSITVEQCYAEYAAAAAAFKIKTGRMPPYGVGVAKKPRVP